MGSIVVCGLAPYNDYVLNNTFLVGNNLPLGAVLLLFFFVVFVNAPLRKWKPHRAFSAGEMTVAFSMTLVSCALPSSGLMRYFPATLVAPFYHARSDQEFLKLFESLHVPRWIFPSFGGKGARDWMNDPIVTGYMGRWTEGGWPPYWAWVKPALTWGIFLGAMYGALIAMVALVRRQWYENERLSFPLAQIYLNLLEEPERGKSLNALFHRKSFWIAFAAVFCLHAWNGLARYDPRHFTEIWVWYDINKLFSEPPWAYTDSKIRDAAIFFTVVGVTYFLPTTISFSLWFFYLADQLHLMWLGTYTGDPTVYGREDQHFGGVIAFAIAVIWIGRHHWKLLVAQALRGARPGEPTGKYISYRFGVWFLVGCVATMILWLMLAGAGIGAAVVMVLLLLLLFMVITRIVAEAGLVHGQLKVPIDRPFQMMVRAGWTHVVSQESYYLSTLLQATHYDFREVMPVYASHGVKMADQTLPADQRIGRRFIAALALALVVGYFTSFFSTLWVEYHYAFTKDVRAARVNDWGAYQNPYGAIVYQNVAYSKGQFPQPHSSAAHFSFGFVFTAVLSFLRLRFAWWPLHPIGYLMLGTFPIAHLWFSTFIGWLGKVLILRFGGARGYLNARPFFMGLIVGESMAAGFWLVMGIVLSSMHLPYRPINIMPG